MSDVKKRNIGKKKFDPPPDGSSWRVLQDVGVFPSKDKWSWDIRDISLLKSGEVLTVIGRGIINDDTVQVLARGSLWELNDGAFHKDDLLERIA